MLLFFISWLLWMTQPAPAAHNPDPSFARDIFPILQQKCNDKTCHGQQRDNPVLLTHKQVAQHGKRIVRRMKDRNMPMPPRESGIKMTPGEIAIIERWVNAGMPNN